MTKTKRPPACFEARMVTISLRERRSNDLPQNYRVICPAEWTKSQFMEYVRAVHPDDAVKLLRWEEAFTKKGDARLWITNPRAFINYKKGVGKW